MMGGCQDNRLRLKSYQQAQARLSTGAGGLGLASAALRRFSASLGNLDSTLPAVVASLTGPLGEAMKERIPETVLVNRMGEAIKRAQPRTWVVGGGPKDDGSPLLVGIVGFGTATGEWQTFTHDRGACSSRRRVNDAKKSPAQTSWKRP